jgi:thymidylate synthase
MVNAWNVGELDHMVLPPCHYGFQVYTRELSLDERRKIVLEGDPHGIQSTDNWTQQQLEDCKKQLDEWNVSTRAISLMWNQRSVDTFLGLPFNIASYGLLLEIIAREVNMVPDELIGNLGDVHLYSNHIEQAKEQITREPMKLPTLKIMDYDSGLLIIENLEHWTPIDFVVDNYESHPAIKAPLSN